MAGEDKIDAGRGLKSGFDRRGERVERGGAGGRDRARAAGGAGRGADLVLDGGAAGLAAAAGGGDDRADEAARRRRRDRARGEREIAERAAEERLKAQGERGLLW